MKQWCTFRPKFLLPFYNPQRGNGTIKRVVLVSICRMVCVSFFCICWNACVRPQVPSIELLMCDSACNKHVEIIVQQMDVARPQGFHPPSLAWFSKSGIISMVRFRHPAIGIGPLCLNQAQYHRQEFFGTTRVTNFSACGMSTFESFVMWLG